MRHRFVIRLYFEDADVPAIPTGRAMDVSHRRLRRSVTWSAD
jgi:hypothetical protein